MSEKSAIEWTDASWNPILGCSHVSAGCDNCYAAREASGRLKNHPLYEGLAVGGKFTGKVRLVPERLDQPLRWKRPRRIFVNSMSDLFHDDVPDTFIAEVFGVMAVARRHQFQVLTKRPGRMASILARTTFRDAVASAAYRWAKDRTAAGVLADSIYPESRFIGAEPTGWPLPNVWLGTSVEDQRWADVRIPLLLRTPAAVRFLSCEPLLGPVDLAAWLWENERREAVIGDDPSRGALVADECRLDWVIAGGESGPKARPMEPEWTECLVEQCQAAGVPIFVKQLGQALALSLRCVDRKGGDIAEFPPALRVREFPT